MPIKYFCKKCRKDHSKDEYAHSRFCTLCGSFLLQTFTKEVSQFSTSTIKIEGEDLSNKEKLALFRVSESLRQKAGQLKEYEVISEKQESQKLPGFESWIWSFEYDEALKFQKKILKQYQGKTLEEVLPGRVISNEQGDCYEISTPCFLTFKKVPFDESKRILMSDLKVLSGIGPANERLLKNRGYGTVEDLERHPRWKKQAHEYMRMINDKDVCSIQKWLWQRLPKSHPLLHYLAGFCQDQDFAIIDIETLGMSERPIVLLGMAKPTKQGICTSQFLIRDIPDEPAAIWALISQLSPKISLITYNGKSFDVPYIRQRLAYYGLDPCLDNTNFDVLHFTRRALKAKLADCRLETVEKYLGVKRGINIPGALVPHFYDTYLRTKNVGPLVPIVEHNKQDLLTLGTLFYKLYEEWRL